MQSPSSSLVKYIICHSEIFVNFLFLEAAVQFFVHPIRYTRAGGVYMSTYEELQDQACADGIDVMDYEFNSPNIKGLYCNNTVAISKSISTQAEKSCVLAEELGHHYTTVGDIIDQTEVSNRKQEYRARLFGYNLKIGLIGIVHAYEAGCRSLYEMAEYLDATEEYLKEALDCYHSIHGVYATLDNYIIFFEPSFTVMKTVDKIKPNS